MSGFAATVDGKLYDFSRLIPLYGSGAVERLANAWTQQFVGCGETTCSAYFGTFVRFLKWIAVRAEAEEQNTPEAMFVFGLQNNDAEKLSAAVVHGAGEAWGARLRDLECFEIIQTTSISSRRTLLTTVVSCLRKLARSGIWEKPWQIDAVLRGQFTGGNIPSLGELGTVEDRSQLRGRVQPDYKNLDWKKVIRLNEVRLAALREIMVKEFESGWTTWQRGQEILADPHLDTPCDADDLRDRLIALGLKRITHSPEELAARRTRGMALMVRYLAFVDPHRRTFADWEGTPLLDHPIHAGGWGQALRHVEGNLAALIAGQSILMIDTGLNITTCERLAAEPFIGDVQRGKVRVITLAAAKLRAGGEMQEGDLLEGADLDERRLDGEISGAQVVRAWQQMSRRVRTTALDLQLPEAELLWIAAGRNSYPGKAGIGTPSTAAVDHHWQAMLANIYDHPVVGKIPLRRNMIRPTFLQLASARGDFEHTVAGKLAQHKHASTTMRYLSRPWFEALLSEKMRKYLGALEATIVEPIEGATEALGTSATHGDNLQHGLETGLGFLCQLPRQIGVIQDRSPDCAEVDRCANCSFRQFNPTAKAIRALVLFERSLAAAEEGFISRNPARWAEVWLDSQALCAALMEHLSNSRHRGELRRAIEQVDRDLADGSISLMELW